MPAFFESRNQIRPLLAALALSLALVACGGNSGDAVCGNNVCESSETAASCFDDCGCGNGVANPGEDCDGQDFGGATCMSTTQHGGTLKCNADCTFDTDRCTLASCGNGIVEDGEACDGSDLGGKTCSSIGYAGGQLGCNADCAFDATTCCSDACPTAGTAECVSNSVRECVAEASGCLGWQVTDCSASNEVCNDSNGPAACTCIDRCTTAGDTRCESGGIETCQETGGCLDWVQTTDCTATGQVCTEIDTGPLCVAASSAEDCAHPYVLHGGQNVVAWAAANADYLSTVSCETIYDLVGPDLVLSYTAPDDGFVHFTLDKPASQREVVVASEAACGTPTPELACVSEYSATTIDEDLSVEMGHTYYFYVRDTESGTDPLPNPLVVTMDEQLCSAVTPSATTMSPDNGAAVFATTTIVRADFDLPIDPTQGVITLTGDMGTNLTFDLATAPAAIAILNDNKTLTIDPGIVFPTGETVSVTWTGLFDSTCAKPIAPPTWSFTLVGPAYTIAPGTTTYADACAGGTVLPTPNGSGTDDEGLTLPISLPAGFKFFRQPVTQAIVSTNGWISVDTSLSSADFSNDAIPNTLNPNGYIGAYWDDLDSIVICTKTVGTKLVVQWTGTLYSSTTTAVQFQAILDPTDNSIEYVYGSGHQATGGSATVGVEDPTGMNGVQYEYNTASTIAPNTSLKVTPN
jgi:hypothetical protein